MKMLKSVMFAIVMVAASTLMSDDKADRLKTMVTTRPVTTTVIGVTSFGAYKATQKVINFTALGGTRGRVVSTVLATVVAVTTGSALLDVWSSSEKRN